MTTFAPLPAVPSVAVVMPVRDEAQELEAAVRSVLDSGYPGAVEVVLAVGPSDDGTEIIAARLAEDPQVRVVDNPTGLTPQGLNLAIAASTHDVVVRMDGHASMPHGYIDIGVAALRRTGAGNVGGRMLPVATSPFAQAVAVAFASRFGLGGAGHRQGGEDGPAASVYLGCFRREALTAVGGYDEHFSRAQDWELNYRLRRHGIEVWFVPEMAVPYSPRSTWQALARQSLATGRWRREVVRRHPGTQSARYLAAPAATIVVGISVISGIIFLAAGVAWATVVFAPAVLYAVGVFGASALLLPRTGAVAGARMPLVLATMHLAWGVGFLRGVR